MPGTIHHRGRSEPGSFNKKPWALHVKTETVSSLGREFPDVFQEGLGKCEVTKATLKLKEGAIPVYHRARPVPMLLYR